MAKSKTVKENNAHACKTKDDEPEALFIPAGVLGGMGLGFIFGNVPGGLFTGLGVGFCIFATLSVIKSFHCCKEHKK
ncbi:MAG: hypothetical protein ACOCUR_01210 [Nanoarchaeota archaeon]